MQKSLLLLITVLLVCTNLCYAQVLSDETDYVGPPTLQTPSRELRALGNIYYPHLNWADNPAEIAVCPQFEIIRMYNLSCTVPSFLASGFSLANSSVPEEREQGLSILDSVFTFLNQPKAVAPINDVWGFSNSVHDSGRAYALVGVANGVSIVDVTVPITPRQVGFFNGSYSVWRDLKVWKNYAYYVQDDFQQRFLKYTAVPPEYAEQLEPKDGLTIIDMTYPDQPRLVKHDISEFRYAHNLFIEPVRPYAYVCGGDITKGGNDDGGIGIFSLEDPENPQLIASWDNVYIHDLVVQYREPEGDQPGMYVLYGAAIYAKGELGEPGLWVVDVTDPTKPTIIGSHAAKHTLVHNVWPTTDSKYLYVTHEDNNEPVSIWDATDLQDIKEVGELYLTENNDDIAAHNVFVRENKLWISYYSMGTVVYDITNPLKPQLIATYDTFQSYWTNQGGLSGNWGVYPFAPYRIAKDEYYVYSSDVTNGLYVLALAPAEASIPGPKGEAGDDNLTWFIITTFVIEGVLALIIGFLAFKVLAPKGPYEQM